jgi:hypothetical protein
MGRQFETVFDLASKGNNHDYALCVIGVVGAAAAIAAVTAQSGPAHALTMTECSAKYKDLPGHSTA